MATANPRYPLLAWYIGLAIIMIVDGVIGRIFFNSDCTAPEAVQLIVLIVVIPTVYLILMYLTFRSQE
ncbi:MAG TPA: hypothetical protein VME45_22145 [Stellaceae bacterium]|nr:hypothetical protein [Stellaceae bacterium]